MNIEQDHTVFPIGYSAARAVVKKAGLIIGIDLNPHDLRRHAATFASRSGAPLEIVSKVILATQTYQQLKGIWAK
ncbi:site-specific integrase [Desulfonatronovibrio magnus]|uniref:site-specific integrase n=1 Tax=Desulfonatronovibrio magnus TaxID=698827 RepID=UPI0006969020|nr:site-specific integrase [Desulfonatronovibrio magnus]